MWYILYGEGSNNGLLGRNVVGFLVSIRAKLIFVNKSNFSHSKIGFWGQNSPKVKERERVLKQKMKMGE